MANYRIKAETESGLGIEYCLGPKLIGLKQGTVTLEQKVTQLFETLRDSVYRYLVLSFGHPAEAEEITQEVFFRLYRHLHGGPSSQPRNEFSFLLFKRASFHARSVLEISVNGGFAIGRSH